MLIKLNDLLARSPAAFTVFASVTAFFTYMCFTPFDGRTLLRRMMTWCFWGTVQKFSLLRHRFWALLVSKGWESSLYRNVAPASFTKFAGDDRFVRGVHISFRASCTL